MKFHHRMMSAQFSNYTQNLVTSYQFHCHHPGSGHHCLLPKLLQWLLNHLSCFCPCAKSILHRIPEYSECPFEKEYQFSSQNPLLASHFTWDKIPTLYHGLQKPSPNSLICFLSPLPLAYLIPPIPIFFFFLIGLFPNL